MKDLEMFDYNIALAEAIANGIEKEEFEIFCLINDLQQNQASLKLFINQQLQECEKRRTFSRGCFFVVQFTDFQGKLAEICEKKETEARKLFAILKPKNNAELFAVTNGTAERIAWGGSYVSFWYRFL